MKSIESNLRRTNAGLQKIAKTVFMGANEIKRLKAEIKNLNKVLLKQHKKYVKLNETHLALLQKNANIVIHLERWERLRATLDELYYCIEDHNLKCEKHPNGKEFFFVLPS